MAVVVIGMATGFYAPEAAWLLVAAGPLGMLEFGISPVLQRLDVLGLAVFVILAARVAGRPTRSPAAPASPARRISPAPSGRCASAPGWR